MHYFSTSCRRVILTLIDVNQRIFIGISQRFQRHLLRSINEIFDRWFSSKSSFWKMIYHHENSNISSNPICRYYQCSKQCTYLLRFCLFISFSDCNFPNQYHVKTKGREIVFSIISIEISFHFRLNFISNKTMMMIMIHIIHLVNKHLKYENWSRKFRWITSDFLVESLWFS